jgi:hypothetical protein
VALFIVSWDLDFGLQCLALCLDPVFLETPENAPPRLREADVIFLRERLGGHADLILRFFRMAHQWINEESPTEFKNLLSPQTPSDFTKRLYKLDLQDNSLSPGAYGNSDLWTVFIALPPRVDVLESRIEARVKREEDRKLQQAAGQPLSAPEISADDAAGLDIPMLPVRARRQRVEGKAESRWYGYVWQGLLADLPDFEKAAWARNLGVEIAKDRSQRQVCRPEAKGCASSGDLERTVSAVAATMIEKSAPLAAALHSPNMEKRPWCQLYTGNLSAQLSSTI